MLQNIVIAVDGPAGAGKSTVAKIISKKLKINYIDSGAMYRAVTYKAIRDMIDLENDEILIDICKNTRIDFKNNNIYMDGLVINDEIREPIISSNVSRIAQIKEIRKIMVEIQRDMGNKYSVIMDGRDIGSYVFPHAKYKFYLSADVQERAQRRLIELKEKGYDVELDNLIKDIKKRNMIDSQREFAPLIKAHDAIEIDTSNKNIDEVVDFIMKYIK